MKLTHEEIRTNERIPIRLFNFQAKDIARVIPNHWHESAELLYCRKGSLKVWINSRDYLLEEGDFLFINSNIIHSTQSPTTNDIIVLQLPLSFIQEATQQEYLNEYDILCNTLRENTNQQQVIISRIRHTLEEMMAYETNRIEAYELKVTSLLFDLLFEMITHFKQEKEGENRVNSQKYLNRLEEITKFVKENYMEKLTLEETAARFNFSVPYFARFFKKYMGITFTEYVTSIRLDKAYNLLMSSDLAILDVSLASGFPNSKSYTTAFKRVYGHTPHQYKKIYRIEKG